MSEKETIKAEIADILLEFQEEYNNDYINRPMISRIYADKLLSFINSTQEESVKKEIGNYDHKVVMEALLPQLKEEPENNKLGGINNALNQDRLIWNKAEEESKVWHDVNEKPIQEKPLFIITHSKDFRHKYRIGVYGCRGNNNPRWVIDYCYSDDSISKWAYIDDLLKL